MNKLTAIPPIWTRSPLSKGWRLNRNTKELKVCLHVSAKMNDSASIVLPIKYRGKKIQTIYSVKLRSKKGHD